MMYLLSSRMPFLVFLPGSSLHNSGWSPLFYHPAIIIFKAANPSGYLYHDKNNGYKNQEYK